jgi:antitoxin component of MazEF toxin-antitoxin module
MMVVVKSSDEETISLPRSLLSKLHLKEGDEVKAVLEGQSLRLSKLEDFLSLRGALANDPAFDEAMDFLSQAWRSWPTLDSA